MRHVDPRIHSDRVMATRPTGPGREPMMTTSLEARMTDPARTPRDPPAHRRDLRLRRRFRERQALGPGCRDVRAARSGPGRRRVPVSARRPDGRPRRADGVPHLGLRAADTGRADRRRIGRRLRSTTSGSCRRGRRDARRLHRRHPARAACSASSEPFARRRVREASPATRSPACSARSTSAPRQATPGSGMTARSKVADRRRRHQRPDRGLCAAATATT